MNEKTILLVEDNPSDIALTKRALLKSGIGENLVVMEDGQKALDYLFCEEEFAQRSPLELPTLVLLDLKLPKIDGFEVLRRIRSHGKTKRLRVVILSSSREKQDLAAGYDSGANSYICKPVDFQQFIKAVESLGPYWLVWNETPP